jgi:hypothetical protein
LPVDFAQLGAHEADLTSVNEQPGASISGETGPPELSPAPAALERLRPALLALPRNEVQVVNLDVKQVVVTALGVWPKVRALEASLRALPNFDVRCFEEFEERAFALMQAQAEFLAVTEPELNLEALVERAVEAREQLIADLYSLTAHGLIRRDPKRFAVRQRGYLGVAEDLGMLVHLFREHWPHIENKTPLSEQELHELDLLHARLMTAIGLRAHQAKNEKRAASLRARAFTLFMRAYDEVRRAVIYLRWHSDDADTIIRSLYEKRGRKREAEPERVEPVTSERPPERSSAPRDEVRFASDLEARTFGTMLHSRAGPEPGERSDQ